MAIPTLATHYELVPDVTSPALGKNTYALKLDKLSDDSTERQLVQVHEAAFYNHVQVVQPFGIKGVPAARGLWLWHANGPNRQALSLDDAIQSGRSRWNRPQAVVYSYAGDCGRLVVSSCLNMVMDSESVIVPSAAASLNITDVEFRDYRRPMEPGEPDTLVDRHLERLNDMGIDPQQVLSSGFDLKMVGLLRSLPESSAPAA